MADRMGGTRSVQDGRIRLQGGETGADRRGPAMKEPRMSLRSKLFATIAIAALAVPASALAASGSYTEPPGNGHGHGHHNGHGKSQKKNPVVTYVFKGT